MRFVIWLSFPVLIVCLIALVTIILHWSEGMPFCSTWVRAALPGCY
jgi:hypothetical protein